MQAKAKIILYDDSWFIIDALHYKINMKNKWKFIKRIIVYEDKKILATYRPSFKIKYGDK